MKKAIAILLVALMTLTLFAACSKKDDKKDDAKKGEDQTQTNKAEEPAVDPIVGTWALDLESMMAEYSEEERAMMEAFGMTADNYKTEYTFNADGTGHVFMSMMGETESFNFTYETEGEKLTMTATADGETETMTFAYRVEGNTLTLFAENGETATFIRK